MSYKYDSEFFDFVNESSGRSAAGFLRHFVRSVVVPGSIGTVLDVGCGRGVWAAEWMRSGAREVLGVDGDYVSRDSLLIPGAAFHPRDISKPFDLGSRFDLVQCLEVAEHVPESCADTLLDNLTRHGDLVLFSAAIPGQGGEFHVNEQPYPYWRAKFASRGYRLFDAVRRHLVAEREIEPWYRYNAFVFANERGEARLTPEARNTLLPAGQPVPNMASLLWRLRCAALSALPAGFVHAAAKAKHGLLNRLG